MNLKDLTKLSVELWAKLYKKSVVQPANYRKPIRLYCDVDGVIQPNAPLSTLENPSDYVQTEITVLPVSRGWGEEVVELTTGPFIYNKSVVERLAALSHSPHVDFVWLTSWRLNAPLVLDELLNIKSVGMLDWQMKFGDHFQSFKQEAIIDEQANHPASYIWIDDLSALYDPDAEEEVYEPSPWDLDDDEDELEAIAEHEHNYRNMKHLHVSTSGSTGLTHAELDLIESWVQEHATVSS